MGLDVNGTQAIMYAKTLGVDFSRTAMIGRQGLSLSPSDLRKNLEKFCFSFDEMFIEQIFKERTPYAEEFFQFLGAKDVHSFDNSDYEGATHIHNMNMLIPEQYKQQYSVVCDIGSLEHIFNFPVAIKNCMELVEVGGYFISITPANNFMGHGFYQFSPELFYSTFTSENGYKLVRLIAFEDRPKAKWYSVNSPASVKGRITLTNSRPVYLLVIAKRIEKVVPFQSMPQQSDYISAWNSPSDDEAKLTIDENAKKFHPYFGKVGMLLAIVLRYTPQLIKRIVKLQLGGFNPRFFKPIKRSDGVKSLGKAFQRTN